MTEEEKNEVTIIREMKTYQTDDARRVEVWEPVGKVSYDPVLDDPEELEELPDTRLFIGVVQVGLPGLGPRETRFEIPGVETIESAFEKYPDLARAASEAVERQYMDFLKQQQEAQQRAQAEQEKKIQIAPAGILHDLNEATK